jgi:phage gp29-like protein
MPRNKRPRPQPVTSIGTWDGARTVDAIIDEAEMGQFFNAALLVDQVLRDDRVRGVMNTRISGLLGRKLKLEPARDIARARKVADEIDEEWAKMFPHDAISELLLWGILLGVGVAQVVVDVVTGKQVTRLEVWHPQALRYDDYTGRYLLRAKEGPEFEITPGDGQWVLYTPYGLRNPGRRGLLRSLASSLYLERRHSRRDRARYSEVNGQPMRVGIAPTNATPAQIEDMADNLSPLGAEPVVIVQQGEPGNIWDVKLVEANGKSQELFEQEIQELNQAIAVLILGQSQSTDGQAGLGSNAEAGELVRIDIMRQDSDSLGMTLQQQVLTPYCRFHYGDGDMAPLPCWEVDPPEDTAQKATELSTLITALAAAKAAGIPIDERAILEAHKVPMLTEQEAAKLEQDRQQKAADAMQAQQGNAENEQPPMKNGVNAPPPAA